MSYQEYLTARDVMSTLGQPVITAIFIISLILGIISIYHILSGDKRAYKLAVRLRKADTVLLIIGFLIITWFHLRIYQTIEVVYPPELSDHMQKNLGEHITSLKFAVPMWIEAEKLYFWTLCISLFLTISEPKYNDLKSGIIAVFSSSLNVIFAVFAVFTYLLSNPFIEPLSGLHSEITQWYQLNVISDPNIIYQTLYQLYFRITYFYNSEYMWTHPPMLFIAYASLVVTFVGCVFMLFRTEVFFDKVSYNHAKIGYLLLSIGMLLGYPWAVAAWGESSWWWDPKVSGSIMMWVLYSAYLHLRIYSKYSSIRKATAILGILCFLTLVFTYLLTYIAPGIHAVSQ